MAGFIGKGLKRFFFHGRLKKIQLGILMLLFVSVVAVESAVSDSTATVSTDPSSTVDPTLVVGETFTVDIVVTDVIDLYGFDIKVGYDTSILTADAIDMGDFFPSGSTTWKNEVDDTAGADPVGQGGDPSRGYAWLSVTLPFGTLEGVDGSGTLATVTFTVDALGETVLHLYGGDVASIEPYTVFLADALAEEIPRTVVDGYFTNTAVGVHDVAITNVAASPTAALAGQTISINVTVENQGDFTETFDVTVKYDNNVAATGTVTDLVAGATTIESFTWDTTGVAEATYTISAVVPAVTGETDTADNTFTDGTVIISLVEVHDVAITDVDVPSTVAPGASADIDVSLKNEGTVEETFDVTVKYDTTVIDTHSVTLAAGATTIESFTWDTTGVAEATYTISAVVPAVTGETDTADNTFTETVTVGVIHDVAITDVDVPSTVAPGASADIDVSLENEGTAAETFDVTVKYDATVIDTHSVTLAAGATTIESFTWDTTGVAEATYTISAVVPAVTGETDTADNTFTDVEVTVGEVAPDYTWYIVAAVVIIVVAAAILYYFFKVRKPIEP